MASYPVTGSTLNSKISTGLSTQIIVKVNDVAVGAIQSLTVTHTRDLERIKELGLDGILEIVPKSPTVYEIQVTRIVFDRLRLPEAFERGFMNIKAQLLPFDILIIDRTNGLENGAIMHHLTRCWFNSYTPKYGADSYILSEDARIWCEDISTTLGSSQASAVNGGARGIPHTTVTRETQTDTGAGGDTPGAGYRGTMDVSDMVAIMNAAFPEG